MIQRILDRIPRPLPIDMPSFDHWVENIVRVSGLPNNTSTRQTAAQFIFHVPHTVNRLSYRFIANQLIRAASFQVAKDVIDGPKLKVAEDGKDTSI